MLGSETLPFSFLSTVHACIKDKPPNPSPPPPPSLPPLLSYTNQMTIAALGLPFSHLHDVGDGTLKRPSLHKFFFPSLFSVWVGETFITKMQ